MSEASDMVSGVSELPLFPLAVVLFPGVPLPLHIFEPRYRQMLRDVQARDSLFGLSDVDSSTSTNEMPPVGSIGCVARVTETQGFPDGRPNILPTRIIRYRDAGSVDRGDPYLVLTVPHFQAQHAKQEQLQER